MNTYPVDRDQRRVDLRTGASDRRANKVKRRARTKWAMIVYAALALGTLLGGCTASSLRSGDASPAPSGYQKIGALEGETLWAKRFTQYGQPRVSLLTTGSMGTICNGGGPYGDYRIAVCDDGVAGIGYIMAVPVARLAHTVQTTTGSPSFTILPAPSGWPYSFAMAVGVQQDLPALGLLQVLDSKGQPIPPAKS